MAENKKSFILYTDLIHIVNHLNNEQAGKLFKHILSYVNDENPISDDVITNLSFEPVKQALKRDLKKYESYIEKQRVNGAKGGRPKKTQNKPKPFEWDNPNHNPNESQKNPLEDEIEIEVLNNKVRIQKFEKFYELYPRHKGNIRMVKDVFMELEDEEVEKIEKTLKDFLKDKEPRYIPFSEKYLEDRRWNDKNLLSSDNPFKGQVAR